MQRLENKYSFNREINDMRINKEKIVLPIDEFDKPDYAFMEQYVRQQIATLKLQYLQEKCQSLIDYHFFSSIGSIFGTKPRKNSLLWLVLKGVI